MFAKFDGMDVRKGKRPFSQLMIVTCLMVVLLVGLAGTASSKSAFFTTSVSSALEVTGNTPYVVVPEGVTDFALRPSENKIFWHTKPGCQVPRTVLANDTDELIRRIPSNGGLARQLYLNQVSSICNQQGLQILSTIAVDADDVYWVGPAGVMQLSTNANGGDTPQLLAASVGGDEVIQNDTYLFVAGPTAIWRIQKSTGVANLLVSEVSHDLSLDAEYLYWLNDVNTLRSLDLSSLQTATLDTSVTDYYAEGIRCLTLTFCWHSVYMSKGNRVDLYDHNTNQVIPNLYVAENSTTKIHDMTSSLSNLFFFEARQIPGPGIQPRVDRLIRANRDGTQPETIYIYPESTFTGFQASELTNDYVHLYWHGDPGRDARLLRLPTDVASLPSVNMMVTSLQITQAVQNDNNTVPLIKNRRTFVVAGVRAEGTAVSGVYARLVGHWNGGPKEGVVLTPVNKIGTHMTVQTAPDKGNIDHHFVFELPWSWTQQDNLQLSFELNPTQTKVEPNYDDNNMDIGPFEFLDSPRMEVIYVAFSHQIGNNIYEPHIKNDVVKSFSWLRRTFPLASTPGFADDPTPGFRPNVWPHFDEELGSRVDRSHPSCASLMDQCAPSYTNQVLGSWRMDPLYMITSDVFLYGMISNASGDHVAGGASSTVARVSSGGSGPYLAYGHSLAAHEISHSMGRSHPFKGSYEDVTPACVGANPDGVDTMFPYEDQLIGPKDDSIRGFDAGDAEFGVTQALLLSSQWGDNMGYCAPPGHAWHSDYTYECIYKDLMGHNAPGNFLYNCFGATPTMSHSSRVVHAPALSASYLSVAGLILPERDLAELIRVRVLPNFAELPLPLPGNDYSLELLDDTNQVLVSYPFTPLSESDEDSYVGFQLLVELAVNTRQIRVVREADGTIMATQTISANAPVVSNVALVNAPNPVSGEVMLQWQATDADGDALRYDVLYSADGRQTVQPLFANLSASYVMIDTALLGGGETAVFRVVAHDGAQATAADTVPFVMSSKAPAVSILEPADKRVVEWGQLVNFMGSAQDLQGRPIGLYWYNEASDLLGTGPLLSLDNLPVGINVITLRATAGRQLSETSVTVIVEDNLTLPAPTLSVSPQSISWVVGPDSPIMETAVIHISNIGTGELDWTITSDVNWLTLSQTGGSTPASVILSADTSGLGRAETRSAELTVQTNRGMVQSFTIPITLSNQNIFQIPSNWYSYRLYLPLITEPTLIKQGRS